MKIDSQKSLKIWKTSEERKLNIETEKGKAAELRLIKEFSRPKILIENIPESTKSPGLYLKQAKEKFILHKESKSTRSFSAKEPRMKTSVSKPRMSPLKLPYTSIEQSSSSNEVLPDWLLSRPDFKNALKAMEIQEKERIPSILEIHPYSRSEEDKKLMFNYLSSIKFFQNMPSAIIIETGNKMIKQDYSKNSKIIKKGDEADCLILIYKGKAGVYLDSNRVALKIEGDVVGELALDSRLPRSADVIAETDTLVFKLLREDYDTALLNLKQREKHQNIEFLKGISFFET